MASSSTDMPSDEAEDFLATDSGTVGILSTVPDDSCMAPESTVSSCGLLKKDKTCLVCGDRALGYNFNAVSCESCKAFFRRNAHKIIRGRCEGQCDVNIESRSFCKRCRLQKCFAVGMNKEMILNADQKRVRKQKILHNKMRKSGLTTADSGSQLDSGDLKLEPGILALDYTAVASTSTASSMFSLPGNRDDAGPSSSLSVTPAAAATAMPHWFQSQEGVNLVIECLADKSRGLLEELLEAHEISLKLPLDTCTKAAPTTLSQFFNLAEGSVLRMIKFAKQLKYFKELTKDDQISLLKGSVVEIMLLRSTTHFEPKSEMWNLPLNRPKIENPSGDEQNVSVNSQLSAEGLKHLGSETNVMFCQYVGFVSSLLKTVNGDMVILKLIIAMCLFAADRPNIIDQETVSRYQEDYAHVCREYIKMRFPNDPQLFARVLMQVTSIRDINETHSQMLAKMNVVDVQPILMEVFDLS